MESVADMNFGKLIQPFWSQWAAFVCERRIENSAIRIKSDNGYFLYPDINVKKSIGFAIGYCITHCCLEGKPIRDEEDACSRHVIRDNKVDPI